MPLTNWVLIQTFLESVGDAPASYIPIGAIPVDNGVAPFVEAAKVYASPEEILDDGWSDVGEFYLAALQYFGQTAFTQTVPTRVVAINRASPVAQVSEFTVVANADGTYRLFIATIGGTAVEAASFAAVGQTVTQIKDALIASFNGGPFAVTHTAASLDADSGTITADVPGVPFVLTGNGPGGEGDITETTTTVNTGIFQDLEAAFAVEKFWCVIPDPSEPEGVMIEVGRWCEASAGLNSARRNVCLLQTNDADILAGTEPNFASVLVGLGYTRSFPVLHANLTDKMTAAYFGRYGAQPPGSKAWHFGRLGGSSETTNLVYSITQVENAKAQRVAIVERDGPSVSLPLRINWGMGAGEFFLVQKQAEDAWWYECGVAMVRELEQGLNLDDEGIGTLVAAVDQVNLSFGTGETPVLDLDQTTTTPVPLSSVPAAEQELGDYKTTGGIIVSTVLTPKLRSLRVSATFALAPAA